MVSSDSRVYNVVTLDAVVSTVLLGILLTLCLKYY